MFVTADARHIVVKWRADIAQLIPHAKLLHHDGEKLLVVQNSYDVTKVLRNVGVNAPPPILTRYDWLGQKPWDIQKTTTALLSENLRAYILNEFGTGKTRCVIWAADWLKRNSGAGRVLIAAPLSTLNPVWEVELFRLMPRARVQVLHGTKAERLERLAKDADFYIINHHGLKLLQKELLERKFDIFVIDELAVFRNRRTGLWKSAAAIVNQTKYAWGMTGSPTPKAPTDAWAQIHMLTPGSTTRTWIRFRDLTMRQITQFKWVRRPGAQELIHQQMQPSVRFALEDVAELPETTNRQVLVPLEPEAQKAYQLMFDKMRIMYKDKTITAVNEGVLQSKLLQVACGSIYTDKDGKVDLPADGRLDALTNIVESTARKVIVFVPFLHALERVADHVRKTEEVAVVHGSTPIGQRNRIFHAFQNEEHPRVIVAHPACMSHGLTLTAANTIIWYCPTNNFETYEQANARMRRPGQTSKTLIAHLVGTPIERLVYNRLQDKGIFQGVLLELFHQQELEL